MHIVQFSKKAFKKKVLVEDKLGTIGSSKNSEAPRDFYFDIGDYFRVKMDRREAERLSGILKDYLSELQG